MLTEGDWDVHAIAHVDATQGAVLFVGNKSSPLERKLYGVPVFGGEIELITPERGAHAVVVGRNGRTFVDVSSAANRMPRAEVRGIDGSMLGELPGSTEGDVDPQTLRAPEIVEVSVAGRPTLFGALLKPRHMLPGLRYPVVVMVYGGPGAQTVVDMWSPRLLWQHLADRGFVVFQLDNRGSAGRGPAFQAPVYRRLGQIELEDQLSGLHALTEMPFVDPTRVAIYGHSYGGFLAIRAMLHAPGTFKVGIAGSPVTTFRLYDTAYTERYMSTPDENPEGYDAADLARHAANLQGKLLILHALMDENVHFTHTAHLADALVAAGKRFDMFIFPGERHGYRDPAVRRYAMRRVVEYLVENV
jgi:dipeptidyl-peptidase-4